LAEPRRGALRFLFGAVGSVLALVYAVPTAIFLRARRREDVNEIDVGLLSAIPEGRPVRLPIVASGTDGWSDANQATGSVFVLRKGSALRVLDSACPHTGCSVDWDGAANQFRCPCHRSTFAEDGARLGGPAPRGLDEQWATVKNGRVVVHYRRFRSGSAARVPV
jgi:menaquinol-cytochrome c reductase iron-sulfur subunit